MPDEKPTVHRARKDAPLVVQALKLVEERREATGVFAKPFTGDASSLDLDGEGMTLADVLKMARLFMLQGRLKGHDDEHADAGSEVDGAGVGHLVEIFVNDERVASPLFPSGAGVATVKYSEQEWALVKSGQRTGFSFDADVEASIKQVEVLVPLAEVRT